MYVLAVDQRPVEVEQRCRKRCTAAASQSQQPRWWPLRRTSSRSQPVHARAILAHGGAPRTCSQRERRERHLEWEAKTCKLTASFAGAEIFLSHWVKGM